jgi:hypothetical protein
MEPLVGGKDQRWVCLDTLKPGAAFIVNDDNVYVLTSRKNPLGPVSRGPSVRVCGRYVRC